MYIQRRASDDAGNETNLYFVAIIVLALVVAFITAFFVLRHLRRRDYQPRFIPGRFLKGLWQRWTPGQSSSSYNAVPNGNNNRRLANEALNGADDDQLGQAATAAVDRNTSVRSVMTLPSYTLTPKASERVIAREGERDGMDVVIEFPETAEEEEANREEQMESLYQIRLARRREIAEREELRQQRREARERGDWARLEELRRESRARAEANRLVSSAADGSGASPNGSAANVSAAVLLAEHQSRNRGRRVSSVSYADIGHVRHDGTRLTSGSHSPDSDSRALLDSAASMGMGHSHQRTTSASSLLSQASVHSDVSSLGAMGADLGINSIPPPYDDAISETGTATGNNGWGDAPPYQPTPPNETASIVTQETADEAGRDREAAEPEGRPPEQPPRLPPLSTLPSIAIEVATPTTSAPPTPISHLQAPSPAHTPASAPR
ncbi:hypothetical protein H109_02118 [Trichophyton interdigitale MR816]|uniref:Uncharacterized protein n=1 Tax=Trichophyton interdigitale (strain MR816) TaxID=1215338 RepID=A0A059JDZ8_TRIIM|nr:hypothetical protein H101_01660 [Trichophyton interdigitale H6]KDB26111.1 hypothetical protein H109_02118 [Trichophyton interdigitale MR816]